MKKFLLGGAVLACALIIGSPAAQAAKARAGAQKIDTSARGAQARAWRECYGQYSGYRGPAGSMAALPAFEACFKQKTGRYPFQVARP
jgi:hypothetical protein